MPRFHRRAAFLAAALTTLSLTVPVAAAAHAFELPEYDVLPGAHPHHVAPAADGGVW